MSTDPLAVQTMMCLIMGLRHGKHVRGPKSSTTEGGDGELCFIQAITSLHKGLNYKDEQV